MSSSTTIEDDQQASAIVGKGARDGGREPEELKLLNLAKMLYERTDESHGLTCPEIIAGLAEAGIEAERKSAYRDWTPLATRSGTRKAPRTRSATPSSRAPSPPPSSCCSPTPCSPRASLTVRMAHRAHRRAGVSGLLPPRRRAFQERARGRPSSRCRTNRCSITWTPCAEAIRRHRQVAFRYVKHDVHGTSAHSPKGAAASTARRRYASFTPRGATAFIAYNEKHDSFPQLPCRSHAGAAHHRRRRPCATSASPPSMQRPTLLARSPCSAARRRRRRCSWRNRS